MTLYKSGFILINKPVGMNSTRVVTLIKQAFKPSPLGRGLGEGHTERYLSAAPHPHPLPKGEGVSSALHGRKNKVPKIGHAGTLDPLASGLLIIAVGEATKVLQFVVDSDKAYDFTISFGEERSTGDLEGEITAQTDFIPSEEQIMAVMPQFIGEIEQVPPAYSAIKINGKRAYELARGGEVPEMKSRIVRVEGLEMVYGDGSLGRSPDLPPTGSLRMTGGFRTSSPADSLSGMTKEQGAVIPAEAGIQYDGKTASKAIEGLQNYNFSVSCSKGTYVRSLARDVAKAAGSLGFASRIHRTKIGKFRVEDAFLLENSLDSAIKATASLLPIEAALDDIPAVSVSEQISQRLRQGQAVSVLELVPLNPNLRDLAENAGESVVAVLEKNKLVAIAGFASGALKPKRIING